MVTSQAVDKFILYNVTQSVAKDLHDLAQCQYQEILRYALDDVSEAFHFESKASSKL